MHLNKKPCNVYLVLETCADKLYVLTKCVYRNKTVHLNKKPCNDVASGKTTQLLQLPVTKVSEASGKRVDNKVTRLDSLWVYWTTLDLTARFKHR